MTVYPLLFLTCDIMLCMSTAHHAQAESKDKGNSNSLSESGASALYTLPPEGQAAYGLVRWIRNIF